MGAGQPRAPRDWWRQPAVISGAVTVVVLAVAITLFVAFGGSSPDPDVVVERPATQQSREAYSNAQELIASGDTTAAVAQLRVAVQLDPSNTAAKEELDRIVGDAQKPQTDPGGGDPPTSTPAPVDPGVFTKPISPMSKLLPTKMSGFEFGARQSVKDSANVPASPETLGGPVSRLLWTVYDMGSEAAAKGFVAKNSKSTFPVDAGTVNIDGASAYQGTDGTHFAVVVYTRGRYVFEVVGTVLTGDPADGKGLVVTAAKAFPEKP